MSGSGELHSIVGAGPVGTALARLLADRGREVRILTRSGSDPGIPGVTAHSVDATDADALSAAIAGSSALFNCANPGPYQRWTEHWPPLAAALLSAAERTGAVLVTAGNLYGYGRPAGPIAADTPLRPCDAKGALRKRLWEDALAAHEAGRIRTAEARSSDYLGPSLPTTSGLIARYAEATLAGRTSTVLADPDQPHSWTAIDDVAATLATLAEREDAWGRAWIVPTNAPRTVREVLTGLSSAAGAPPPRLRRMPRALLRAVGVVSPLLREVGGILYQFDEPFTVDDSRTRATYGLAPSSWDQLISDTALAWQRRAGRH